MFDWFPTPATIVSSSSAITTTLGAELDTPIFWVVALTVLGIGVVFLTKKLKGLFRHVGKKA